MGQDRIQVVLEDEGMVAFVRDKVRRGEYASESDVVRECVAACRAEDEELEEWLTDVGVPAYERLRADRSHGIPLEQVKAKLVASSDHPH